MAQPSSEKDMARAKGAGPSPGEVHDIALKAAETDATKRAFATFGKPFGLELYRHSRAPDVVMGTIALFRQRVLAPIPMIQPRFHGRPTTMAVGKDHH